MPLDAVVLVLAGPSHLEKNSFTARQVRPSQQVVEKAPSTAMPPHCAPSAEQSDITPGAICEA